MIATQKLSHIILIATWWMASVLLYVCVSWDITTSTQFPDLACAFWNQMFKRAALSLFTVCVQSATKVNSRSNLFQVFFNPKASRGCYINSESVLYSPCTLVDLFRCSSVICTFQSFPCLTLTPALNTSLLHEAFILFLIWMLVTLRLSV